LQCQTPAAETQPTATGGEEKARRASVTGYTVTCSGTRRELFQTAFAVRALLPRLLESQLRICKSTQVEPQHSVMEAKQLCSHDAGNLLNQGVNEDLEEWHGEYHHGNSLLAIPRIRSSLEKARGWTGPLTPLTLQSLCAPSHVLFLFLPFQM
jgi:hypothetical protein